MPSGRYVNRVWQDSNAFIQKQDVYKDATYSAQKLKLILQNIADSVSLHSQHFAEYNCVFNNIHFQNFFLQHKGTLKIRLYYLIGNLKEEFASHKSYLFSLYISLPYTFSGNSILI